MGSIKMNTNQWNIVLEKPLIDDSKSVLEGHVRIQTMQ